MCFDLWTSVYCLNRYYDYIVIRWFITTWATVIKTFFLWENLVAIVHSEWKFCNHLLTYISLETPLLFLRYGTQKEKFLRISWLLVCLFFFLFQFSYNEWELSLNFSMNLSFSSQNQSEWFIHKLYSSRFNLLTQWSYISLE